MPRITDRALQAITPRAARFDVGLGGGLYVRVHPDGRKVARYRYRFGGKTRVLTLGEYGRGLGQSTLADLLRAHTAAVGKVAAGGDPALERDQARADTLTARAEFEGRVTLDTICTAFKRKYNGRRGLSPRTTKEYHRHVDRVIAPQWGRFAAEALPIRDMLAHLDTMPPVAANRVFATLHAMLNWAVKQRYIAANPLAGIDRPGGVEKAKSRALDWNDGAEMVEDLGEIRAFWAATEAMDPAIRDALRLILLSGQRPSEVLAMRRSQIAGKTWRIPAAITKSKKRVHVVPVTATMQALIDARPDCDLLFRDKSGEKPIHHARLSRAVKEAAADPDSPLHGVPPFTPHDLRRTCATHLGAIGYMDAEIGLLLNHATAEVTRRYNQADAEPRIRPMLEAWHRRLSRILKGSSARVVELRLKGKGA